MTKLNLFNPNAEDFGRIVIEPSDLLAQVETPADTIAQVASALAMLAETVTRALPGARLSRPSIHGLTRVQLEDLADAGSVQVFTDGSAQFLAASYCTVHLYSHDTAPDHDLRAENAPNEWADTFKGVYFFRTPGDVLGMYGERLVSARNLL